MSPSLTTIVTTALVVSFGSLWIPKIGSQWDAPTLLTTLNSSSTRGFDTESIIKFLYSTQQVQSNPHTFRPAGPTDSRSPCPALNTLANHGYLPRSGKNISTSAFLEALEHPETYHLSPQLARVLAKGGELMIEDSVSHLPSILFRDSTSISLHDLSLHGGVEHDASIVHKNTARGQKYAPERIETSLLEGFFQNRTTVDINDIAYRRAELEYVSGIDPIHAEVARGEWALVLDIFGKAHDGKIPTPFLREWLRDNRFPAGWRPNHVQGLLETVLTSRNIKNAMADARKKGLKGSQASYVALALQLGSNPEAIGKHH